MKLSSKMLKEMIAEEIVRVKEVHGTAPPEGAVAHGDAEFKTLQNALRNVSVDSSAFTGIEPDEQRLLLQLIRDLTDRSRGGSATSLLKRLIAYEKI